MLIIIEVLNSLKQIAETEHRSSSDMFFFPEKVMFYSIVLFLDTDIPEM